MDVNYFAIWIMGISWITLLIALVGLLIYVVTDDKKVHTFSKVMIIIFTLNVLSFLLFQINL